VVENLWKYGWLILTLAITLLVLAHSRVPETPIGVINTILVVVGIGAIVFSLWPRKKTREKWSQMEWYQRLEPLWEVPVGIAILLFVILPIGLISMFSFYTAIETFVNLFGQYLDLLLHHPLDWWKLVTGQCPSPYECP